MNVILEKAAFLEILAASLEAYKRESIGLLFGIKRKGNIIVKLSFPPQTAKRFYARAEIGKKAEERLISIFENFARMKLLGFFHSHPEYGDVQGETKLSDDDINSLAEGEIAIVIAINRTRRNMVWKKNLDSTISGTVDHYFFKIAAYLKNINANDRKKITQVDILIKGLILD